MMEYPDCAAALRALESGDLACQDFRAVRQAVMCRVWHSPAPAGGFSQALRDAWAAVEAQCPQQAPAAAYLRDQQAALQTWRVVDRQGNQVGLVAAYGNGEVDVCALGNCRNEFVLPGRQDDVVAAMQDILPIFGYSLVEA